MNFKEKLQTKIKDSINLPFVKVQILGNRVFIILNYLSHPAAAELLTICTGLEIILSISVDKHSDNLIITFTDAS